MSDSKPGPAGTLETPADVKRKQVFLITLIAIVIVLATFFTTIFGDAADSKKPTKKEPVRKSAIAVPGATVDPREVWIGTAGDQIASLEKEKRGLEERIQRIEDREKSRDRPAAATESLMPAMALPPPTGVQVPSLPAAQSMPTPSVEGAEFQRAALSPPPSNRIATTVVMASAAAARPAASRSDADQVPVAAVPPQQTSPVAGSTPASGDDRDLTREDYVPAGSFFRAVMLSGLDAPTGGQVQANPHPVLLRLVDNAILPNRFRAQVSECFVVAAGYGDMSSERAYLRTESLSCVNRKGQVIDVPINGWAIGDDGKAGIRGRVVSKQGQAIANAIMSGVLGGLGSAIRESSVTTQSGGYPGTVVQTPKPGKEFRAGVGAGISKGLDRLTEYYIDLAERIFPVIEVDAGRVVDVALNKGMSLKGLYKGDASDGPPSFGAEALKRREASARPSAAMSAQQQP